MGLMGALRRVGISIVPGGTTIEGVLTADNVIGSQGATVYVNPAESAGMSGRTPGTACSTIAVGEAKLTAGQNDTLVYLAGTTSASIVDTLDWDKDYTHFTGVAAPLSNQSRARIFNSGNTTGGNNLINISAKGCAFKNLRFFQGSAIATAYCAEVSGDWNYFENVTFQGMGHATPSGEATNYSLKLTGASLCEFYNCTIGGTSTLRTDENTQLLFSTISSQNTFKNCKVLSYAETNTYCLVKAAADGIRDWTIFEDCYFYNRWAGKADELLEVFELPTLTHAAIQLKGSSSLSCIIEWNVGANSALEIVGPIGVAGTAGSGSSGVGVIPS